MESQKISAFSIAASACGALFETYDMFVYAALVGTISKVFLSGLASTQGHIIALLIFALGFISRPIGALIFGHIGDKFGRKKSFIATIVIMGLATTTIGCLPSYAQIGVAAPVLLVICRLLQGISFGGEMAGSCIFVYEHAPSNKRGFYTSILTMVALCGLPLGYFITAIVHLLTPTQFDIWGWRLPYLLASIFLIVSLILRLLIQESPVFLQLQKAKAVAKIPLWEIFSNKTTVWKLFTSLLGFLSPTSITCVMGYLLPLIFLTSHTTLDKVLVLKLSLIATLIGLPFGILAGWLSDRINSRALMGLIAIISLFIYFPIFQSLLNLANIASHDPSNTFVLAKLLGILIVLSILGAAASGIYPVLMAEYFPAQVRCSASSLVYNVSAILFFGFVPMIVESINSAFHSSYAGLWYPIAVLIVSLGALLFFVEKTAHRAS